MNLPEKKIGVAMYPHEWTFVLGFLMHCCTDEQLVQDLWNTKDDLEEMEFMIRQIQRQVFLVKEKIEKIQDAQIVMPEKKLILPDGTNIT
jgi:hypothetical protein